jgi:hypothetical protein
MFGQQGSLFPTSVPTSFSFSAPSQGTFSWPVTPMPSAFSFNEPPKINTQGQLGAFSFNEPTKTTPGAFSFNEPMQPFTFMMSPTSGRDSFPARPQQPPTCDQCGGLECTKSFCVASKMVISEVQASAHARPNQTWPPNWYCDYCQMKPIIGVRMHCTVCTDYDLCEKCDRVNDQRIAAGGVPVHDPTHVFVKLRPPSS